MKLTLLYVVLILVLTASVIAQGKKAQTGIDDKVEQELINLTHRWDEAVIKRDVNTLDNILAEDYVVYGRETVGKAFLLGVFSSPDVIYSSYRRKINQIRIYENTAVVFATNTISGNRGSSREAFSYESNSMDLWIRQSGQWRCVTTTEELSREETAPTKYSLIVYLKEGLSEQQIDDFVQGNFFQPRGERGFAFQKGIYLYSRISPVQKHAALAIGISDATERENIKARIKASPLVYKILEEAVPPPVLK